MANTSLGRRRFLTTWAATLAVAAAALATWSLASASHVAYGGRDRGSFAVAALVALIVGVLVAVECTLRVWRGWRGAGYALWWPIGGVLLMTPVVGRLHARDRLHVVLTQYVHGQQLPALLMSWIVLGIASVILLGSAISGREAAAATRPRQRTGRTVTGAMAAGVAVALVATGTALYFGDDSRFIDATTAADPVDPQPFPPEQFGPMTFQKRIDEASDDDDGEAQIMAAGTGFAVLADGTLTMYGSDGAERWHYRRTGPGEVTVRDARILDEGRTVVLEMSSGRNTTDELVPIVALDATTGQQLWSAISAELTRTVAPKGASAVEEHLVAATDDYTAYEVYNPRTGARQARIELPAGCSGVPADTRTRVLIIASCGEDGKRRKFRLFSADPATGTIELDAPLFTPPEDAPVWPIDWSVQRAGQDGLWLTHAVGVGHVVYVNAVTKQIVELPDGTHALSSTDAEGQFLVPLFAPEGQRRSLSGAALYGPDGHQHCVLADSTTVAFVDQAAAWLHDQILVITFDGKELRLINRSDCTVAQRFPLDHSAAAALAAPGVTLIRYNDQSDVIIDGHGS